MTNSSRLSGEAKSTMSLVSIEGLDGSGKTTLAKSLAKQVAEDGVSVRYLKPASFSLQSMKCFSEDRGVFFRDYFQDSFRHEWYFIDMFQQVIAAKKASVQVLVCDRWPAATRFFLDCIDNHDDFFNFVVSQLPKPELTLMLNVEVHTAINRLKRRKDWMTVKMDPSYAFGELSLQVERYAVFAKGRSEVHFLDGEMAPADILAEALPVVHRMIDRNNT